MSMRRTLVFLLLVFLPILNGCGGSATPTEPTTTASAGIVVSPGTTIITDETGLAATLTISLASKPTADVTIPVSSSNPSAGTVNKDSLVFTSSNWATGQTITITGANGALTDGNQSYNILLGPAVSTDPSYSGLQQYITATNLEVRAGSFVVSPISGNTSESGVTATFTVRLGSAPSREVTLPVQSSAPTEGVVDKASLTFTTLNWEDYQTVTVTGVDDALADGNQDYSIILGPAVSTDSVYNNLNPDDLSLTNLDVKTGFVDITLISGDTDEAGAKATFQVKLRSQPAAEVTIQVSSSDDTEGLVSSAGMVSPAHNLTLTFTPDPSGTPGSWNDPQTVTVTGVDDPVADGTQAYSILLGLTSSADDNYNGLGPWNISLNNHSVKTGRVTPSPISGYTDESTLTATFLVSLNAQPAADVTIPSITSSDPTEGTVSPAFLTFTPGDWSARMVTVTGVDDDAADGNQAYSIILAAATSLDDNFDGFDPDDVSITNVDLVDPYGVTPRISAGSAHSLVLAGDGTVWGWGACKNRELDPATATCPGSNSFVLPQRLNISRASAVSAGSSFSAIVQADRGSVWTSGFDQFSRLGRSGGAALAPVNDPLDPTGYLTGVTKVATGTYHSLALKVDGTVWAWGLGGAGQLGDGGNANQPTAVPVTGPAGKTVTAVATGEYHSLALDSTGQVYSWGSDASGQLGQLATSTSILTPTPINLLTGVSAIAAGQNSSFAVGTYDGTTDAYGWGMNLDYVLGTPGALSEPGTSTDLKNVPTGLNTFVYTSALSYLLPTKISAGTLHALALANDQTITPKVYSWGDNDGGEQGILDTQNNRGALAMTAAPTANPINPVDKPSPTLTKFATTAIEVSAGNKHSLVLLSDGRMQTSGNNDSAQLGTNPNQNIISGYDITTGESYKHTDIPVYVEDPGDLGTATIYPFYAYRPILSGQPATATTDNDTTITVCKPYPLQPPDYCKGITHYKYSTNNDSGNGSWDGPFEIASSPNFTVSSPTGPVNIWVKGMTSATTEIQTNTSAAKVSWTVVAAP